MSPNGSEDGVENFNNSKGNNSEFTSQNSMHSQSFSIRHQKTQGQLLDQMLLGNRVPSPSMMNIGAPSQHPTQRLSQTNIEDLMGSDDTIGKKLEMKRKSINLQLLGLTNNVQQNLNHQSSPDANQFLHSNTPSFNYEQLMRVTSRSSGNQEESQFFLQANRQDKDDDIHNLVDDPSQMPVLSHPYALNYYGNQGKIGHVAFSCYDGEANRGDEIMEEDQESQGSSFDGDERHRGKKGHRFQGKEKQVRIQIDQVGKEDDQDSFKSSISMEEDQPSIPLDQIKSTDSRQVESKVEESTAKRASLMMRMSTKVDKISQLEEKQLHDLVDSVFGKSRTRIINQKLSSMSAEESHLKSQVESQSKITTTQAMPSQATMLSYQLTEMTLPTSQPKKLLGMIRQQNSQEEFTTSRQISLQEQGQNSMFMKQGTIVSRQDSTNQDQRKFLLKPMKQFTRKIKDDKTLEQMVGIILQKKIENARKDFEKLITVPEEPQVEVEDKTPKAALNSNMSKIDSLQIQPALSEQAKKEDHKEQSIRIALQLQQSEEDELLDLSEMLAYTQDCVTPSDMTPMSTLDNNRSVYYNPDASLDYSTLQIEYMAENADQGTTPNYQDSRGTKTPTRGNAKRMIIQGKNVIGSQPNDFGPSLIGFMNDKDHAKTPKNVETKQFTMFSSHKVPVNHVTQPFLQGLNESSNKTNHELTRENLKKLEGLSEYKSYDDTPKSQVTRSVISGRDNKGKRKINQYIVLQELGKGSYAEVYLCVNEDTKQRYAMKILNKRKLTRIFISKERTALHDVEKEIAIMKKLDHPNVVRLIEVLDDPTHDRLYIIMEYLQNGSLMKKLSKTKNSNLQLSWKYFRDLIQGLNYLHECAGVIHRDIKPENLLLDENDKLKIADFGVSFLMENGSDMIATTAGSNYFFSPEVCLGTTFKGRKSDIWAAGVTLYLMVFKKYPFTSNNIPDLYNKIQNQEPDFPADSNVQLVDMLKRIFIKDPEKRASLLDIMNHDWVTSNGVNPVPRVLYPKVELTQKDLDSCNLFKSVWMISKIKLKFRNLQQRHKNRIKESTQTVKENM